MLFWSHLGSPGASFRSSLRLWGLSGRSLTSGGLSLLRRLRRSTSVAYFIELITNREFIFCAQAAWTRALWRSWALWRPLFSAQAAQIRVRRLFHSIVNIWGGLYFLRRLRGSSPSGSPGHCDSLPFLCRLRKSATGTRFILFLSLRGSQTCCAGCGDPRPLLGSPGVFSARLGSPGLSLLRWALLCSSGLVWALLGSSGLLRAFLGSPGLP